MMFLVAMLSVCVAAASGWYVGWRMGFEDGYREGIETWAETVARGATDLERGNSDENRKEGP